MSDDKPRIAITMGDPAGIGPEVARKASEDPRVTTLCEPLLFGEANGFAPGRLSAEAGRAAYDAIVSAVEAAKARRVTAIATAPINKEAFALAGLKWRGHTELLAELCGGVPVAMLFHSERLRVVLATVHVPLAEVPRALTLDRMREVIGLTARALPRFGYARPRLAVTGLNPHAGEHGLMGDEEGRAIAPAIAEARERGLDIAGPFPADTVFIKALAGEFDAVIACYHDQGLIPVKMASFGHAVNVTIGLPIVRTSVDHGTAFDIAGRGVADPESMVQAVLLAVRLSGHEDTEGRRNS
jgi:4-hydroxythreonine-4-phosphate dehydrogenase